MPLTFRKWLDLLIKGNALLTGGRAPLRADYLDYIWTASARYRLSGHRARFAAWRFRRSRIHRFDTDTLEAIAYAHLDETFFDQPRSGGSPSSALPAVEPLVSHVCELAAIARINPVAAFDWPVVRGFAVIREHARTHEEGYVAPIPRRLNALQLAALKEIQGQMDAARKAFD